MDSLEEKPGSLLTVDEVAELLHVPQSWVYEHTRPASRPLLPHMKVGKYLRFRRRDIEHFISHDCKDHVAYGAERQ